MLYLLTTTVTLVFLAGGTIAQFEARPPSAGPWYDHNTLGQAGDFGRNESITSIDEELASIIDLTDLFALAERHLSPAVYARIATGTMTEETKRWNTDSFKLVRLRPRILRDITSATTTTEISLFNGAGEEFHFAASSPFFFSPSGDHGGVHPDAELATIRAAAEAGVITGISASSTLPFADIGAAKADNQTLWYQLYARTDSREDWLQRIHDVQDAGYSAVLITVDIPAQRLSSRAMRAGVETPDNTHFNNITWDDIAYLKDNSPLPIVLKGIQTHEDAIMARDIGVAGIDISNHGNRAGDGVSSTLEVLLDIRKNAPGLVDEMAVFLDGGVYSGTNAVKALALGARMVGLGRPVQFGLVYGQAGVKKMIDTLNFELLHELQLVGATRVAELNASFVNTLRLDAYVP